MNAFLNPHNNGPPLTGIIEVTAHSISLFQENEPPQNIQDIFIPKNNISVAESYDVQIDELGNNTINMYQFIGDINDTKVGGLESLLNYMNDNFHSRDNPTVNEHHYHTTRTQYNQDFSTHNIYNVEKSLTKQIITTLRVLIFMIKTTNHKQFNELHNQKIITNNGNDLNVEKPFSTKNCLTNVFRSSNNYTGNIFYKKYYNRTCNSTNTITKHINNYNNYITNNCNINKIRNLKTTCGNFNDDVVIK